MPISLNTLSESTERTLRAAERNLLVRPALLDPVSKLRVSTPVSLIDTDFEYGPQSSKWETYESVNGYGGFYRSESDDHIPVLRVSRVVNHSDNITDLLEVRTSVPHNLRQGDGIAIYGTRSVTADGTYNVHFVRNTTTFTYYAKETQTILHLQSPTTRLYPARLFQGGAPTVGHISTDGLSPSTLTMVMGSGPNAYSLGTRVSVWNTKGRRVLEFSPQTDIDETDDFITIAASGLSAGQRVTYGAAAGSDPVGGLTDRAEYRVQYATQTRIYLYATNPVVRIQLSAGSATGVHTLEADVGSSDGVYDITEKVNTNVFKMLLPFRVPLPDAVEFEPLKALITHNSTFRIENHGLSGGDSDWVTYSKGTSQDPIGGLTDGGGYRVIYVDQNHFTLRWVDAGSLVPTPGVHSFQSSAISGPVIKTSRAAVAESSPFVEVPPVEVNMLSTTRMNDVVCVEVDRDIVASPSLSIASIDDATSVITLDTAVHPWLTGSRLFYDYYLPDSVYRRAATITIWNVNPETGFGNVQINLGSGDDYQYLFSKYGIGNTFFMDYQGQSYKFTFNASANTVIRNTTILRGDGSLVSAGELPEREPMVMYELLTTVGGYIEPVAELTQGDAYYVRRLSTTTLTLHPTRADAEAGTNAVAVTQGAAGVAGGTLSHRGQFCLLYSASSTTPAGVAAHFSSTLNDMVSSPGLGWEPASGNYNSTGRWLVRYLLGPGETAMPGFTEGGLYYAYRPDNNLSRLSFFATLADAEALTNVIDVPAGQLSGYIVGLPRRRVLSRPIAEIHSSSKVSMSHLADFTTNTGDMVTNTMSAPMSGGLVVHRSFDGGVEIIPSPYTGSSIVRQTRRYFRYQSGKGIQMSVGVNFSGPSDIDSISSAGVVITRAPHRMKAGVSISLAGVNGAQSDLWNLQNVVVQSVTNSRTFVLPAFAGVTTGYAPGFPRYVVDGWPAGGPAVRVGMFDDQNGMFFEYDGQQLFAVRRNAIQQLPGHAYFSRNNGVGRSQTAGVDYSTLIKEGDRLAIRGQTYTVSNVGASNATTFAMHPPYRGDYATEVVVSIVQDMRVPSSEWTLDTCDGSGDARNPSGYRIDIHKMQMAYIDYSWYGAGKIRFGFKGIDGEVFFVHEFTHNNHQDTAYMRSGNLPARYEVASPPETSLAPGPYTYIPKLMHWGTSVIMDGNSDVDKAFFFTVTGRTLNFGNGDTIAVSATYANSRVYSRRDPLTGATVSAYQLNVPDYDVVKNLRSGTGLSAAGVLEEGTRIVGIQRLSGNAGVIYIDNVPLVPTSTDVLALEAGDSDQVIPGSIPLVSFRLAPSVDSGYAAAAVGERDLINRMQLSPLSVDILSTHDVEISMTLNGFPVSKSWEHANQPSLAQILYHSGDAESAVIGGTRVFSFRAAGGPVDGGGRRSAAHTTVDVSNLTPLGNSLVGGDDVYPNGPDILTISATLVDSTNITSTTPFGVSARLSWIESQA